MSAASEQRLDAESDARARQVPLVLVSNRGPVTFDAHGEVQRGSGGVVTALSGLASHRDAIWIASAMREYDAEASRRNGERPFAGRSPTGGACQMRFGRRDRDPVAPFLSVGV